LIEQSSAFDLHQELPTPDKRPAGSSSCPVRVVHVAGQLDMGGLEKLLVEFARHVDRSQFSLHFVSLAGRGVVATEIEKLGWPVTDLKLTSGFHPWFFLRLARFFRRVKADVVHTHSTRPLIYAGPAACLAGVRRVIHTRHGQRYGASRRETAAFRTISHITNWVVCVSQDSAQLTAAEGVSSRRIKTILNGIDIERFRQSTTEKNGPVLTVGRLSPEKDFATLIRAAGIAAREDPSFRLDIAGGGPCADALQQLVHELELEQHVRLLGQVTDMPALMAKASIFALSSLTEGISLTILEAMASGLPIVATSVGGNSEVVADEETGLLVPPANPAILASALLALWRDSPRRIAMGAAGRARVEAVFDVRKMVDGYEELYK
jgi:glycosyltransferase involved in cell wall biosynthesis